MRLRNTLIAAVGFTFVATALLSAPSLRTVARRLFDPEWKALSLQQTSTIDGLTFAKLSLRRGPHSFECSFVQFNAADFELIVIDNGPNRSNPHYRDLEDAMIKSRCSSGANGGFFEIESFAPNGLMIANGNRVGTFARDAWSEGVFVVRNSQPALESQGDLHLDDSITPTHPNRSLARAQRNRQDRLSGRHTRASDANRH